ncbi:MAG: 3-phosphoshikimate 1-carboxyvinyltransferase [Candidatus Sericytochromatia bacterium]|nr:3-phosphoshikimate 1-carboxyvinyltransferase [Candidatus Tanganyikabacteria bacterium]
MTDTRIVQAGGPLVGRIRVPGDKSLSHRAAMFAAIAEGPSRITGFLAGEDCLDTLRCLQALGVPIVGGGTEWDVDGVGLHGLREPEAILDVGNSGTSIRLLLGLLAGLDGFAVLTGDASIRRRPMGRVARPLRKMGMRIDGRAGGDLAPLAVRGGPVSAIAYESPVASAQVKSAVLLAALRSPELTTYREPALSRDHTERMLAAMGADLRRREDGAILLRGGRPLAARDVQVPGDLSSAAFWLVAGAIVPGSDLVVENVGLNPSRTGLLDVLLAMGADLAVEDARDAAGEPVGDVRVRHSALRATTVAGDLLTRSIDEIPILTLALACAAGTSEIRDAAELRVKESDRLAAVSRVLGALGARIEERPDGLIVTGPTDWRSGGVASGGDHRIAMTAAIAGRLVPDGVEIEDTACTETSYPGFWETTADSR